MSQAKRSFFYCTTEGTQRVTPLITHSIETNPRISNALGNRPGCGKTGRIEKPRLQSAIPGKQRRRCGATNTSTARAARLQPLYLTNKVAATLAAGAVEAQHAIPRHSSRGACYDHSHLDLARSPNHRKADPALRRIGCEYSHLDLTTHTRPCGAKRGTCYEHSRHRPRAISEPRRGRSGALR
jgi:hypothetical protein